MQLPEFKFPKHIMKEVYGGGSVSIGFTQGVSREGV